MQTEQQVLAIARLNPYLETGKILGEDQKERLSRFGLIVENANQNWDLTDRDEGAIRTANAILLRQQAELGLMRRIVSLVYDKLLGMPSSCDNCTVENYENEMVEIRKLLNEVPKENT